MIQKCPKCKTAVLIERELDSGLKSHLCNQCLGNWVPAKGYWAWIESRPRPTAPLALPVLPNPPALLPVQESESPKFCPECGRFLRRYKIGHGFDFSIERCGTCGGFWLDGNEWENLLGRGIHDRVHFVVGDAWQAEVARHERERGHEQIVLAKIGAEDLDKIKGIKAWLDAHPRRAELYAFLLDHSGAVAHALHEKST